MADGEAAGFGLVDGVALAGVACRPLDPHDDARGSFTEVFVAERDRGIEPTQWSVVRSEPGAFRGMHLHRRHDELVTIVRGRLAVGLHDLRPDSPTRGAAALYRLDDEAPGTLTFPRGIVHGWLAERPAIHVQAVSESYATYADDDNVGCRWDDPELGIAWPARPRLLSERAAGFGSLADLRAEVAGVLAPR